MNSRRRLRRSPRLPPDAYAGSIAAHVTIVASLRESPFSGERLANICLDALNEAAVKYSATIHAYCVMPDHLHLLIEVPAPNSLQDFVRLFKQLVGFRAKRLTGGPTWQVSYHDRILRLEESLLDVANYIWENPVKAGLVDSREDYPFSGPPEKLGTS